MGLTLFNVILQTGERAEVHGLPDGLFSAPQSVALIQRLRGQVYADPAPNPTFFDPELLDMFLSGDPAWMMATDDEMQNDGIPIV